MTLVLPKRLNIDDDGVFKIIEVVKAGGGSARLVGGVVRDLLLGLPCKDIDIATDLPPENILTLFKKAGYKAIPTGIKFGTVTVVVNKRPYEITTLRRDLDADGRHAKVEYSKSYEEDAARRDFTINALSYDPIEEKIYDYFGGLEDLESRQVRFIGKPDHRIKEDYLRILRFFRFSAYYAKDLDNKGIDACAHYAHNIQKLSGERVKAEIDRLIASRRAPDIFRVMIERGIWQYVFARQELNFDKFDVSLLDKVWGTFDQIGGKELSNETLYALMMLDNRPERSQLLALKFSRNQAKMIESLYELADNVVVAEKEDKVNVVLAEKWLRAENWQQYFIFAQVIANDKVSNIIKLLYKKFSNINKKPVFPVRARSLVELGIEGKELGIMLESLRQNWIESDFSLTKEQLLGIAAESNKYKN